MAKTIRRRPVRPGKPAGEDAGSSAKSLNKAIDILVHLGQVPEGMSLPDISLMVGQPKSTMHRLLTALEGRRFVRYEPDTRLWKIGVEAFVVGSAFLRNRDIAAFARPVMQALVNDSGETASLYVEDEGEIVCISQVECRQTMRVIARPGGRAKMHTSGSGKAMLAYFTPERLADVLERHGLVAATEKTINTPQGLRGHLDRARRQGFAIDDEENSLGIRCVAAPVFDHASEVIAAVSISGPASRIVDARIPALGERVRAAALALTRSIAGVPQA
ncbi:MAG: IclR family transcriptional regulator [Rhizobiales bacterium]|nr:IclR family transcriptional regulator [Hyphomicrobiales bacterium]MBI3672655.1 IclR family transcriptional regulator [Hyphomicrobiales bacterium]